jgi:hypothetical protein
LGEADFSGDRWCGLLPPTQNVNLDGNALFQPAINDVVVFSVIMILMSRSEGGLGKRDAWSGVSLPRRRKGRKQISQPKAVIASFLLYLDYPVKAFIPFINLVGPIPAVRHFS